LLRRGSGLSVVVVRRLWALVSVLLWWSDVRQRPSNLASPSLLTGHRSFAVEADILAAVGHRSRSGAGARRSHRDIVVRGSKTW
jgi:hypothetical protein